MKVGSLKGEQRMLYNFIEMLVAISSLAALLELIVAGIDNLPASHRIFLTAIAVLNAVAFSLMIIWAGGWVG